MNLSLLLTMFQAFWSEERYHISLERLYQPTGVAVFRVYFRGMLKDIVAHPRVDFSPQSMRELLLDDGYSQEIIVVKNTGILRG